MVLAHLAGFCRGPTSESPAAASGSQLDLPGVKQRVILSGQLLGVPSVLAP